MKELTLRPEVAAFARIMEAKLRENDHKSGWKHDTAFALLDRVEHEVAELRSALFGVHCRVFSGKCDGCREEVVGEAADVANFAMMVADVVGGLEVASDG